MHHTLRLLAATTSLLGAAAAYAGGLDVNPGPNRTYEPKLATIDQKQPDIQFIQVTVNAGLKEADPSWEMSQTAGVIFLNKLLSLPMVEPARADEVWRKAKAPEKHYKGLTLTIHLTGKESFQSFRVFEGKITAPDGTIVAYDPGRLMEYWIFGTARIKRDQILGAHVLPILSFEHCRLMGNTIVETTPRQCMLEGGDIFLESNEEPTAASLKAHDFSSCLRYGKALIYTYPRRCMAAGGHVFTEPPSIAEPPADAPLLSTQPTPTTQSGLILSPTTTVSPLIPAVQQVSNNLINQAGLGTYAVPTPVTPSSPAPSLPLPTPVSPSKPGGL